MTTRRQFLKVAAAAGGGVAFGFRLPPALAQAETAQLNAWVVVRPDETVIIRYARSEMGQGSLTAAAQLVAEELMCDWENVRVEYVDAHLHAKRGRPWGDLASVNSATIRDSERTLRLAGAAARETLVAAAAQAWGVDPAECRVEQGIITHGKRRTTYGAIANRAVRLSPPAEPTLKAPSAWKLIGTPVRRVDIPAIVTGEARYAADVELPDMLHAAVAHCPVFGGTLKAVDESAVLGRRGVVKVLPMGDFVAVVADNGWRAREALRELPVVWEPGPHASLSSDDILLTLQSTLREAGAAVARHDGEPFDAIALAERVYESEYFTPYLAHATLEPQTCTAVVRDGFVDVWAPTQDAEATHRAAAEAAGVPLERVYVHRVPAGGGFGRRAAQDYTREAVAIAKAMNGVPVKTTWSRAEDLQHDLYRPASLVRLRAGLDAYGNVVALHCRVAAPSVTAKLLGKPLEGGVDPLAVAALADMPYELANVRVEYARADLPLPVGFWRGGGHSQNPFARECFLDELAYATGRDPYEFRRALLAPSSKALAILDAVAKAAGWDTPPSDGVHRGMAVSEARGSFVAAVAEVAVREGLVNVSRLVLGIDCGHAVNPDAVTAQLEGAAAGMLGAIFWNEITLQGGRVLQSDFNDYRMLRLREMPKVEVLVAPSGGFWGGVGEPAVAVVAPAVANALFAATGRPVRSLPLRKEGYELATTI